MLDIFQYPDISFPKGFLWGAATAGMQVEGSNSSYHDDEELAPKFAYGGIPYVKPELTCNSFVQFEDDIALLKAMHLTCYRMSIEWSRIEPEEGKYDEGAIQHYRRVLERLQEEKIKVCLTLHHVSHPVWFHKKGAFQTMDQMEDWKRYLHYVVPIYAKYVDFWLVLNELNLVFEYDVQERINMLQYHAVGYHIVKEYSDKPVSSTISFSIKEPMRGSYDRADRVLADYIDYMENEFFIHAIKTGEIVMPYHDVIKVPGLKDSCDFWALNTYIRQLINSRSKHVRFDQYQASRFNALPQPFFTEEICPEIMYKMLHRFQDRPIMITENGIAVSDDRIRIVYISAMLQAMKQAMDDGIKVWGYLHWSLMDNWEWGSYHPTFGLASVDLNTFERTLKPSGYFYGEIAKANALTQTLIRKHLDVLPSIINR
ncbi:MAG: family 1 glycosylhydrolase [Erysipelotrichaceae bacterium]